MTISTTDSEKKGLLYVGHAFSGQIGLHDVLLRVEHNVAGSEHARKAFTALSTMGKNIGETGLKVRQSISQWSEGWLRTTPSGSHLEEAEARGEQPPMAVEATEQEGIGSKMKMLTSWFKRDSQPAATTVPSEEAKEADASSS